MTEQLEVRDWNHLVHVFGQLEQRLPWTPMYLFRGQSDSSWNLQPTLTRMLRKAQISDEGKAIAIEDQLNKQFRRAANALLEPNQLAVLRDHDRISWWTVMRHHGVPTRLLDWTLSPYVACYFAVSDAMDSDGAVWYLHEATVSHKMRTESGVEYDHMSLTKELQKPEQMVGGHSTIVFVNRAAETARMTAQRAVFAVPRHILSDHEEVVTGVIGTQNKESISFGKVIIPRHLKPLFLLKLYNMNVTSQSLFPGLDGLGKTLTDLVNIAVRQTSPEELESDDGK